ncbi:hypothetical protein ACIBEJ_41100 [Nonomuraea sp. NPDC050790]|uniref:hypothetical protein n=1 Tax=Nonomuraea sp. NPDC050790 TaxID=3364371 RepID=UPI003793BE65
MIRMVVAYALAALSAAAIIWCTLTAMPVDRPLSRGQPDGSRPLPSGTAGERRATTEVTITRATPADLRQVPPARIDERQHQVRVTITHTFRMDEKDPLAGWIRGSVPADLRAITDKGLGAIKVGGGWLAPTVRYPAALTTSGGRSTAEFRVIVLRRLARGEELTLEFQPPGVQPSLINQRTITLFPTEWTVLRTAGLEPEREEAERLQFTVNYQVTVTLVHDSHGFVDHEEEKPAFSWGSELAIITAILLIAFLLRSLGRPWWQRLHNRELFIGLVLAAPLLAVPFYAKGLQGLAYVVMFGVLPAIAVRHASRMVPTPAPWTTRDALAVTALGVLVAFGMFLWSARHVQLHPPELIAGVAVAALAAAGAAIAFSADLGIRFVVVRLAVVAAGTAIGALALALWFRALLDDVYPPDSVHLVLGLFWSLIPIGAVAVVTRTWSRGAVVAAVILSLLMQGWPTEWLDDGSWSTPVGHPGPMLGTLELTPLLRGVLGLLLLGFVLLVLRLRRLGGDLGAVHHPAAVASVTVCLMVLYLSPRGTGSLPDLDVSVPLLSITSVVAWISAWWLLGPVPDGLDEPRTHDEHRAMVRRALHKRHLLVSEQELYRVGRGRIGAGELSMGDFEQQREDLETALDGHGRHPETAFATSAGCTPWHNGVHAFVICLLLSLPFLFMYGLPAGPDLASYLFDARYLLTMPAFGFLFGYFYPRIRGTQPMTKVLHLMAAALVTELSAYLPAFAEPDVSALDKVQLLAIVVGQVALVYIALGLFWEWRLMHLAGEPWGRVRNVRSLRSLATPLVAVLIAAVTTAATSAASQSVDRILRGDQVQSGGP